MRVTIRRIAISVLNILIAFSYGIGVNIFFNYGKPFIRGFYCNDNSISYPYHTGTIPSLEGTVVVFAVIIIVVAVGEAFQQVWPQRIAISAFNWKKFLFDGVCLILVSVYGAGITMFITDVGKYSIGRLRPHFIDVCKPDWSRINCTDSHGRSVYVVGDDLCTTDDLSNLKQARLSFPSGHSSFTMFGAVYVILYIQHRIPSEQWGSLGKIFIQVIPACGAFFVGLSRVSDYKHHPGDVLAGFAIGIAVAVFLYFLVLRRFYTPVPHELNSGNTEYVEHVEHVDSRATDIALQS